jgi:hypothetical protein
MRKPMEGYMIKFQGFCIVTILAILVSSSLVQTGAAVSTKVFDLSYADTPAKIISCSDGGFAIAGTALIKSSDFLLIRTDQYGRMNWIHVYGGQGGEVCNSLAECADGGFVLVGQMLSISEESAWIIRVSSNGVPLWNLTIPKDEDTSSAELLDVIELPSGEIFAAGDIRSRQLNHTDAWLMDIDANGTLKWSKTYGQEYQHQICKSLILCQNGDVLMAGDTANDANNLEDFWMLRITSAGFPLWQRTFNRVGNENFDSVIETHNGGFALAGYWARSWWESETERMFLLRTDSAGNFMWNRTYSGSKVHPDPDNSPRPEQTRGADVVECADEGFAVVGSTNSFAINFSNIWLVRTDSNGNPIWNNTLERNWFDYPVSMAKRENTSFAIIAETRENITSMESDILLTFLSDEAPYSLSTTTSTLSSNGFVAQALAVLVTGTGAAVLVILCYRYKRK